MPTPARSSPFSWIIAVVGIVAGVLAAGAVGVYLGRNFRPRPSPVQIARQPASPPTASPSLPETPSVKVTPAAPGGTPHAAAKHAVAPSHARAHPPSAPVAKRKLAARQPRETKTAHRPTTAPRRPHRTMVAVLPAAKKPHPGRALPPAPRVARAVRRPARQERSQSAAIPLRPVAKMPPARPLPVPREVRQRQVAHRLAAARWRRIAERPRRERRYRSRRQRLARAPRRSMITAAAVMPGRPGRRPMLISASLASLETVRYVEQPVALDNQPAMLATYIVWDHGTPRTFSFVRQEHRTDQAQIVSVDPTTGRVQALVPARGALVEARVSPTTMLVYHRALEMNPPSSDLLARAEAISPEGMPAGPPVPPTERVAGMREIVGKVQSVDPASRIIVLAGPRMKTPFQVPDETPLPKLGDVIVLTVGRDGTLSPLPALGYIPLQPTVEGRVTRVVPMAVQLSVRSVSPDGQIEEVPVPVSGNAKVFIAGQPGDLRALKRGIYIRAYMTPTGETRILGMPSE